MAATWRTTSPSRSPSAFGVFTGTKKPVHTVDDRLGKPASATVGTWGTAAERCGVVTARPLSLPDVTNGTAGGSVTTDSSVLKPEAVELVAKLGDIIAKYPEDRVKIIGYTDSTGSVAHNEELSLRRAKAVRDVLQGRGVKQEQMLVEGMGPERPIASNGTAAGRAQNRRVELHIDVPTQMASQ